MTQRVIDWSECLNRSVSSGNSEHRYGSVLSRKHGCVLRRALLS